MFKICFTIRQSYRISPFSIKTKRKLIAILNKRNIYNLFFIRIKIYGMFPKIMVSFPSNIDLVPIYILIVPPKKQQNRPQTMILTMRTSTTKNCYDNERQHPLARKRKINGVLHKQNLPHTSTPPPPQLLWSC